MKQLHDFPDSWYVSRIVVERNAPGTKLRLTVNFTNDSNSKSVELVHPDNEDILTELLDAERIVISQEIGSQREYGTICIECFGESYFECWCDSAKVL